MSTYTVTIILRNLVSTPFRVDVEASSEDAAISAILANPTPFMKMTNGVYINLNETLYIYAKEQHKVE